MPLPHPKGYVCLRATTPPRMDGSLDCPVWDAAPWTDDFIDISTDVVPRFRTRAKMLWDDQFFYVAADMEEPHVWGTLTEHDSVIFQDNDFEVFIDPDGDNHRYYEIEINALNTTWDLLLPKPYRDSGSAVNEWEAYATTAVHVRGTINDPTDTDDGWSVVMAFPWKPLAEFCTGACPPKPGDQWRVNFSRVEWQTTVEDGRYVKVPNTPEDNWVWSPQFAVDMHRPEMWGYVQFSSEPVGSPEAFRLDPSWPARDALMQVYWAQRAHRETHGSFAGTLEELGISVPGMVMNVDGNRFVAKLGSLMLREDSLIQSV